MKQKLPEICEIQYGFPFDSEKFCEVAGTPLIRIRDVKRGFTETYTNEQVPPEYMILGGEILIGMDGEFNIAKWGSSPAALNQRVCHIIPNQKIASDYLYYALPPKLKEIEEKTAFVTVKHLSAKALNAIEIDVPVKAEQERIAAILNSIVAVIEKRTQQLTDLDTLIKARFVEMFGDSVQNPFKWPTKSLLDMGYCKNGMNFHTGDSGIEIHCLGVGDFKDLSSIGRTDCLPLISLSEEPPAEYLLHDGDIVFVRSNGNKALVGRCVVVYPRGTPTVFSGFCIRYRLTSNEVETQYLLRVLKSDSVRKLMVGRGANIQNLNQQTLAALNIPIPNRELQVQFSVFVRQVDKLKVVVQKALDEAQTLFDSLMQQYFG